MARSAYLGPQLCRRTEHDLAEVFVDLTFTDLPEGPCPVTSDEVPGLVAQERTACEALQLAQDVIHELIASHRDRGEQPPVQPRRGKVDTLRVTIPELVL